MKIILFPPGSISIYVTNGLKDAELEVIQIPHELCADGWSQRQDLCFIYFRVALLN